MRWLTSHRRLGVTVGAIALALVLVLFGANIFGRVLAPLVRRIAAGAVVIVVWLALEGIAFLRHQRANARMLDGIKKDESAVPDVADENARDDMRVQLGRVFEILKEKEIGHGLSQNFFDALPYYIVAGPPQSGKTSLLGNADLTLPLAEALKGTDIRMDVRGEHTQWWFTDNGLLIGASPKGMEKSAIAGGWRGLLAYLKEHRPRHPLDAIILVFGVDMLLRPEARESARYARARLQDALRLFSVSFPVYFVVSKCDLLPGFTEYFADLEEHARANAFGAVLPIEPKKQRGTDRIPELKRELTRAVEAATRLLPFRIAAERSAQRRAALIELPAALGAAADAAIAFASELTRVARGERRTMLRGVFFTSAGTSAEAYADPIDVWAEQFSAPLGLRVPPRAGARTAPRGDASPPLFVSGVFRDFVFPEAGLGGRDATLERRMAFLHGGGYALCGLGLIASGAFWLSEFNAHSARLAEFRRGATEELTLERNLHPENSIAAVLPLLNVARRFAPVHTDTTLLQRTVAFTPLDIRNVLHATEHSYNRLLVTHLLPLMLAQLEASLQSAVAAGDAPSRIRSLLAVYLMLGEPDHFSRATVGEWGSNLINADFALQPETKADALAHWRQLLALMPLPVSLNGVLIAEARSLLRSNPTAEAIYAELKLKARQSNQAVALNVVSALGRAGSELLMLRSQAGLSVVVPKLYTREGFYRIFLKEAPALVQGSVAGNWVVGAASDGSADAATLLRQVTADYVRDYITQWQSVLSQIVLRALPDLPSLVAGLQALAAPDSPIVQLIRLVQNQTDLPVPPPDQSAIAQLAAAAKKGGNASKLAASAAAAAEQAQIAPANPLGTASWPGNAIHAPFVPLVSLLAASGGAEAPAMAAQSAITSAYGVVSGIAAAQSPPDAAASAAAQVISGQSGDPLIQLRVRAASLPDPLGGIFRALYRNIWQVLLTLTQNHIQADWARSVAPVCQQSIAGHYPFAGPGEAAPGSGVALQDFSSFFGPRGVIDGFIAKDLAPFTVVGAGGRLSLASQNGLTLRLPGDGLREINRAREIGRLFFAADGNPAVSFALTPAYLDPRVLSATLAIDGTSLVYQHEPPRATEFHWPPANVVGSASIRLRLVDGQTLETNFSGPWALFRLFATARTREEASSDRLTLAFTLQGYRVSFLLGASSVLNPFADGNFREFRCVPRL